MYVHKVLYMSIIVTLVSESSLMFSNCFQELNNLPFMVLLTVTYLLLFLSFSFAFM